MPQGLLLGPFPFVVYTNDLDENVHGRISKFADNTDVGGIVESEAGKDGYQKMQQNPDQLAEEWLMEFKEYKCDVLHFGN